MPIKLADIELRSEEVQSLLTPPSHWLLNSGGNLFVGMIVLVLLLGWVIRYPDIIQAEGAVHTSEPAIQTQTPSGGKLAALLVKEGEQVSAGQKLAEIESELTAEGFEYLMNLIPDLDEFQKHPDRLPAFLDEGLVLGELQNRYLEIRQLCLDYHVWKIDARAQQEIDFQRSKRLLLADMIEVSERQWVLDQKALANARHTFEVQEQLYREGVIAELAFLKEQNTLLAKEQAVESLEKSILSERLNLKELGQLIVELNQEMEEQERVFGNNLSAAIMQLKNELKHWRKAYWVESPIAGTVAEMQPFAVGQHLDPGTAVYSIVPVAKGYVAHLAVSADRYGKIKLGNAVHIQVVDYPFEEYGHLTGKVVKLGQVPDTENRTYHVEVELGDELITHQNQPLAYRPGMIGNCKVITREQSVLARIFHHFLKLVDVQTE
ncbi:HlyD family efflux transporter periplasmic adaptor subunit [Pontibacter sp. G13]|uniref:HlyD family secretion protein n=1 Tax=Pontibacter sp. G13 TaxID=3074898 RepID=UPI002889177A|nr:HlyD family efflux transporter periplasmic adaptor subunit [Pontibacter sp. G13]WNJ20364.1 HlyD family efflux transporter periplasmic adaptor subunit [Pontibacter sp. G13]